MMTLASEVWHRQREIASIKDRRLRAANVIVVYNGRIKSTAPEGETVDQATFFSWGMKVMRALICGISGQDGTYLADLLLAKGYDVVGSSRDAQTTNFLNLSRLGIAHRVQLESMAVHDFRSVLQLIHKVEPDEIFNLSGQSSVGLSFSQPIETLDSIISGTLNLLESIRFLGKPVRFYNAGSSECYGDTDALGASEDSQFRPRSPYAVAKSAAYWLVANYREAYGLHASTGILFNHESPIRPERFVTRKIVTTACRISRGSKEKLTLGNLQIRRDWGWAPEYVDAMWRILQCETPGDFVIATGTTNSLEEFVSEVFAALGLDWRDHTSVSEGLLRPTDISEGKGNPGKAERVLGWKARLHMKDVVSRMVQAELENTPH
jgi:GDPmannose 4,6-dehydratase